MNNRLFLIALLLPVAAIAQDYQGMSQQDMQKMMQGMQQMQSCMQNINQAELQALGGRAEAMQREIKTLCQKGQRDQAQGRAMSFAMEVQQNHSMQQLSRCGEKMAGMLQASPFLEQLKQAAVANAANQHICD